MLIKVCGITTARQAEELDKNKLASLIGLIFYPGSKRATTGFNYSKIHTKKVGVFVNAGMSEIKICIEHYQLDLVQLHGNATPHFCKEIKEYTPVIKAIPVGHCLNKKQIDQYKDVIDFILFDTETSTYGGSGKVFNWNLLHDYTGNIPFLLSGGIGLTNCSASTKIDHPNFLGIDINSQVETAPGIKNITTIVEINKLINS